MKREFKPNKVYGYTPAANGRSYCFVVCPYCGSTVKAYVWSISGGGKKCKCGALHSRYYTFSPIK